MSASPEDATAVGRGWKQKHVHKCEQCQREFPCEAHCMKIGDGSYKLKGCQEHYGAPTPTLDADLNPDHAARIAWHQIYDALKSASVEREKAIALPDAYSADFAERVRKYTRNLNAITEELKRRG